MSSHNLTAGPKPLYCTAIVAVLDDWPPMFNTTGTALPELTPNGTRTLIWLSPIQQPASPAKSGVTLIPPMLSVTGATVFDAPAGNPPVATAGVTCPSQVA